jgi:hypothetical protein
VGVIAVLTAPLALAGVLDWDLLLMGASDSRRRRGKGAITADFPGWTK